MSRPGSLPLALAAALAAASPAAAALPAHPGLVAAPEPAWVEPLAVTLDGPSPAAEVASAALRYLLLDDQARLDGRRSGAYHHIALRVLTPAGLENASQHEISFDPSFARVVLHHLRVSRRGDWSDRLEDAVVTVTQREADFSRRLYDGSLSVLLVLKDVQVGDVVSLAYTVEGENPVLGERWYDGFDMGWSVPVDRRRVRVLAPAEPRLAHRLHGADGPAPTVRELAPWREHTWDRRDLDARRAEAYLPAGWDAFPWLQLSQYGSWAEVVEWAVPLYRVPAASLPELAHLAATLSSAAPSEEERLLAAIRWVQDEVRYFGIMLGPNSHAPHPPHETIRNRFGDCKDKALLLVALLRQLGADAWPALVDLDDGEGLPRRLPSPGAFDHVVVLLRHRDREVWVDPTTALQGGTLATLTAPDLGHALVVRPGETGLARIPATQTDPGTTRAEYAYVVGPGGEPVDVTITTAHERAGADELRNDLASVANDELARRYVRFYSRGSGRVEPTAGLEVHDDRAANRLTTVERYRLQGWWQEADDGGQTLAILPLLMGDLLPTLRETSRSSPLGLPRRARYDETVTIAADPGWRLEGVEATEENPWFELRATSERRPDGLAIRYQIAIGEVDVPAAEVGAYLEAAEAFDDALGYTLTRGGEPPAVTGATAAWIALAAVAAVALALSVLVGWALRRAGPV